jgi:hypothetical protein
MSRAGDDGFLSRWSRRKVEARTTPPEAEPEAAPAAPPPEPPAPEMTDAEIAALPPIETAGAEELRAYLKTGVPAALKTLAMRRMWGMNAAIRDYVDPALDYAWDWNVPGDAPWSALGAGDDPKKMVERILGRSDDAQAAEEQEPASEAAPPPDGDRRETAAAERTDEAADAQPASVPITGSERAATRDETAASDGAAVASAPATGRRRRHGGAAPS